MPADPMTLLQEAATSLHELYLAYLGAGFSEEQAFCLVCVVLDATFSPGPR